jgi:glyoxylase I family protein
LKLYVVLARKTRGENMAHTAALDRRSRSVVSRMEHVQLTVADLERSIEWYGRVFDFSVRWTDGRTAHVGTDRFYVAVTERDGIGPAARDATRARIAHFAFTTADLAAFSERLDEAGIEPVRGVRRWHGDSLSLRDPDGNAIEVVEHRDDFVYA